MSWTSTAVVLAILVAACRAQIDCSGKPDGSYGWGCRSYTRCQGGTGTSFECTPPEVFNEEIGDCDDPLNVGPPCGLMRDCSGLEDGRYADQLLNCTAFYTCQDRIFFGYQPCNPGLVFDDRVQICTWPYLVPPPCGTCEICEGPDSFDPGFWTKTWMKIKAFFGN